MFISSLNLIRVIVILNLRVPDDFLMAIASSLFQIYKIWGEKDVVD